MSGEHRGKEMGVIMDFSQAEDLGETAMDNFKPYKQCISAANKARVELFRLVSTIS